MHESFGVCGVGGVEHTGAFLADDGGGAVVHVGGNVQAEPGMAVFVVVPAWRVALPGTGSPGIWY